MYLPINDIEQPIAFTPAGVTSYTEWGGCWYRRIGNHLVEVQVNISGTKETNYTIFTLPEGYRPYSMCTIKGQGTNTGDNATLRIDANGTMIARPANSGASESTGHLSVHVIFGV